MSQVAPIITDEPAQTTFPDDDSLCELCGYPLRGLTGDGQCPECGSPADLSHYNRRVGLPWQNGQTLRSFAATCAAVFFAPRLSFRMLRLGRFTIADRSFLAIVIIISAAVAGLAAKTLGIPVDRDGVFGLYTPLETGAGAGACILVMTLIEVLGVAFFSKRRGWRVPQDAAGLLCAYASVGWILAAVLWAVLFRLAGALADWFDEIVGLTPMFRFSASGLMFALSLVPFEVLVYIGLRQIRFANRPPRGSVANPSPP